MSDLINEFIKNVNISQLVAICVILWFFYNRLDNKIDKSDAKFDNKFDKLDQKIDKVHEELDKKIDKLDQKIDKVHGELDKKIDGIREDINKLGTKVEDVDRRLCRIEGSLTVHGHCLFQQSSYDKKAE